MYQYFVTCSGEEDLRIKENLVKLPPSFWGTKNLYTTIFSVNQATLALLHQYRETLLAGELILIADDESDYSWLDISIMSVDEFLVNVESKELESDGGQSSPSKSDTVTDVTLDEDEESLI